MAIESLENEEGHEREVVGFWMKPESNVAESGWSEADHDGDPGIDELNVPILPVRPPGFASASTSTGMSPPLIESLDFTLF